MGWRHAQTPQATLAAGGAPHRPDGSAVDPGAAAPLPGLLVSAGDVWACVIEVNRWRWARQDRPLVSYQELCRELAASGPGTFGELDTVGARSVLRRYSDAWFAAAKRRKTGDRTGWVPAAAAVHDAGALVPRHLHAGRAAGADPGRAWLSAVVGAAGPDLPYPPEQVRSITLLYDGGRLYVDVTAEVPVTTYPAGLEPDPARVAGVDLGVIHPYAVAGPDGQGLLVSGRAIRAEHRMHLADTQGPRPGGRPPRAQARAARVAALAPLPAPPAAGRGPPPASGPPGPARSRQDGDRLGGRPAGRHPGRR